MTTSSFSLRWLLTLVIVGSCLFTVTSCQQLLQDHQFPNPMTLTAAPGPPVAAGLLSPIGLAEDDKGNLWVTQAGSGTVNNGQVSVITPTGTFTAIAGFASAMSPENSPEGLNHLAYKDGKLYILHGTEDKLYIVDVSGFVPGSSAPIQASSLAGIDLGTTIRSFHPNAPDPADSNPYDLTFGPDGDLFITDAGANAIIRRDKDNGALSVYAVFPDVPNPTPVGPPTIDAVPTGIVFNGTDFLVTTLVGFPFPTGLSAIYKVSGSAAAPVTPMVYQDKFSGLTSIALTPGNKPIVTEFGFSTPSRVANGEMDGGNASGNLFSPGLPPYVTAVDILSSSTTDTYYALYYGPGIIVKLTATH
ncbi:ScyD/ScyE family protein [Larkinella insperata]|uniref:ScyD/ScyE family protein n=1 Tax=Larkinella insperata TaxID=332158 RepID=A0ABW3Q9U5_9BACT|nr:ScyD/ScyE family protein [Larkinella insperata]